MKHCPLVMTGGGDVYHEGHKNNGDRVIESIIRKAISLTKDSHILEIGSGTGANLPTLTKYGHVTAMELDDYARSAIPEGESVRKVKGWLPDGLDEIRGQTFSLIG